MSRFTIFLFLILSFHFIAQAKKVDEQTARAVAYNYYKSVGHVQDISSLQLAYTASTIWEGSLVNELYIFNVGSNGFVMVSADDIVKPVLGYSTEGAYDPAVPNDNFKYWMDWYQQQILAGIINNVAANEGTINAWRSLMAGATNELAGARITAVSPMLKSKWGQTPFYNDMCPYDAAHGVHALTGCTATAMAQVFRYWQWPKWGNGTHSYTDATYGVQTVDFGATRYEWEKMPDVLSKHDTAVATLMYQAGVSVNMVYGVGISGAIPFPWSISGYFGYKNKANTALRAYPYVGHKWIDLVKSELDSGRPVIYGGYNAANTMGHTFVADGYDASNNIHFNWGENGVSDGYFSIDSLVQLVPFGDTFTYSQSIVFGIEPDSAKGHLDVATIQTNASVSIYPNPACDIFYINASEAAARIRMVDVHGRIVKELDVNATEHTAVDIRNLAPGMYFIQSYTRYGITNRKILISH